MRQHPSGVTSQIETVTPAIAARWLGLNVGNRSKRENRVDMYAENMGKERWVDGVATIQFNGNDKLLNGQHTLEAVVRSGVPIVANIVRGLPAEARQVIDTGLGRTFGDTLHFVYNIPMPGLAAAITMWMWRIDNQRLGKVGFTRGRRALPHASEVSRVELVDYFLKHRDLIEKATRFSEVKRATLPISPTLIGAAYGAISREMGEGSAEAFFDDVTNNTDLDGAAAKLRRYVFNIAERSPTRRPTSTVMLAVIIKAFNRWLHGEPVSLLAWTPTHTVLGESFPLVGRTTSEDENERERMRNALAREIEGQKQEKLARNAARRRAERASKAAGQK